MNKTKLISLFICGLMLSACGTAITNEPVSKEGTNTNNNSGNSSTNNGSGSSGNNNNNSTNNGGDTNPYKNTKTTFSSGESFYFDNLEIKVIGDVQYTTIDNIISDYYEKDIIKVGISIKNLKSEANHLNSLYVTYYGPGDKKLDSVESYFDDSIKWNDSDVSSGTTYNKYLYLTYINDGTYKIIFNNVVDKLTVELPITIGDNGIGNKKQEYNIGEKFRYHFFEITGGEISYTTIDNEFADNYEKDIIRIPLNIKNLSKESQHLTTLDYKVLAPNGVEIRADDPYFDDGISINSPDLATGASYVRAIYVLYSGDGTYKVDFNGKVKLVFNITIGDNGIGNKKQEYNIGEKFRYHFFEITGGEISFTTVSNQYSTYYGKDIVRIPLTIKNLSKEAQHLNSYSVTIFGSKGTEVEKADTYFDDSLGWKAGDLDTGASYIKAFYAVYDGNGTYKVDFNGKVKLVINVNK